MKKRVAIVVFFCLGLAGCSGTTFLYNRLHIVLPWMLGSYVDLDREQKDYLKAELKPFLYWHRMEELPRYVQIIDQMEASLDEQVTPEEMAAIVRSFEEAWARLEGRGLELMMDLGERLSDEQMQDFLDSLDEQQAEYQEKYLERSDEEYYEDAYENFVDSAQDFMGRLSAEQKEAIRAGVGRLIRSDSIWVEERAAWNRRLADILDRDPGWQQEMRDAVASRERDISPAYRETYLNNSAALQETLADLLNSRSEAQDRKLRKTLDAYRDDFESLVEQGADKPQPIAS